MSDKQDPFGTFFDLQGEAMREMFAQFTPGLAAAAPGSEAAQWAATAQQLQGMWMQFLSEKASQQGSANPLDPMQWMTMTQGWAPKTAAAPQAFQKLMQESMDLWQGVFGTMLGQASGEAKEAPELPRKDRRFSDPAWQEHPAYALLHQTYLMLADYFMHAAKEVEGVPEDKRAQLKFATQALLEAMSPDNFLATNPVVLKRTIETGGQNLVKGMQHLINDLKRGQLTHTDADAFTLGENLAATPGKVVHETPIYQLIQYSPSTEEVLEVPLVIFPPWINRFYILDLTPKKSFIKWAVDQGITVFVVSWKSADESMRDVVWDDYIRAQIDAIDHVRERLDVPSVHTIGYCVAGTTLAATLAILARRDEAEKVKSATFFTAQVDFERAGELLNFIDNKQLEMIGKLSPDGYLDGRYLAATFNALRGKDLIWNYVVNNYMLGEDYPAFDLLHWNGDVTNLPAKWHGAYLRDLYRDNKLVQSDALSADGTPIDLTRVETPTYVQAGKEDHIAPAESVWRITDHFKGDVTFLLAGSGHIAGVVNPPSANKYQYWTGDSDASSLGEFVEGATEHPGSWWPHWLEWLHKQDDAKVQAKGKRKPGGKGDTVIEDAPGRYVKTR
ncbi:alpha/beta hydrolase [Erythrobacter sp. HKB08]|uniref:PHA/PHB synthase family protein n=1 Tax=Erythrobacter sp. HKB08 TaxID=2502843 RepID=UPI0010087E02|nr:class I poly(R)-hydroxyalkanoic acid synthase [Erythrobacter sp. HKB08]